MFFLSPMEKKTPPCAAVCWSHCALLQVCFAGILYRLNGHIAAAAALGQTTHQAVLTGMESQMGGVCNIWAAVETALMIKLM